MRELACGCLTALIGGVSEELSGTYVVLNYNDISGTGFKAYIVSRKYGLGGYPKKAMTGQDEKTRG